jgi:serine/threonine-protein kinase
MTTAPRLPVGTTLDRFRIGAFVAGGGMGAVYRATDLRSRAVVALKVMTALPHGSRAEERFDNEARVLAAVAQHPGLPRFLAYGASDGRRWLAMEFIDGETLDALVERRGPLPWREALMICAVIGDALAYLHARGVLHRDVKPANLKVDGAGRPRLLDLGIAIAPDNPRVTSTYVAVGTPAFMAPERLMGEEATPSSDLWSLGVVLYHLLTARLPFEASSIDALRLLAYIGRLKAVREHVAAVPAPVEAFVARTLAGDLRARPGDAAAWSAEARALAARPHPTGRIRHPAPRSAVGGAGVRGAAGSAAVSPGAGMPSPPVPAPRTDLSPGVPSRPSRPVPTPARPPFSAGRARRPSPTLLGAVIGGTIGLALLVFALRPATTGAPAGEPAKASGTSGSAATPAGFGHAALEDRGPDDGNDRRTENTPSVRPDPRVPVVGGAPATDGAPADPAPGAALRIAVTEGTARVFLDGRYAGTASLAPLLVRAPVGRTLVLRLVQPGFTDYVTAITIDPLGGDFQYTMERQAP